MGLEFYCCVDIYAGCFCTGSAFGLPLSKLAMNSFFDSSFGSFLACNAYFSSCAFISNSAYFFAKSALLSISLASYYFFSCYFFSSSFLRSISCYNYRCFSACSFSFLNLLHSPFGTWFAQSLLQMNLWHSSHFLVLAPHIIIWSVNCSNLNVCSQKPHALGRRSQISSCWPNLVFWAEKVQNWHFTGTCSAASCYSFSSLETTCPHSLHL